MDYVDYSRGKLALGALSGRIRELSIQFARRLRLARPKESLLRKLKAASFVGLAILFGTLAHRLNREETELQWRKSHLPSAAIWETSFAAEGFRPLTNPSLVAKVTRRLPSLADTAGRIWNASPDWWVIETSDGSPPLLFCSRCELKLPPRDWNLVGSGWEGWETAMKAVKEEARQFRASYRPRTKKRGEALDPREIRY